jgi:dienelactone hydrolase
MAEVLVFHHVLGLGDGVRAFADELRASGHVVHTPDLFEGREFTELSDGLAYVEEVGFGTVLERGRAAAESFPVELVYAGLSLGVLPAQMLAQTRPGAKGALLLHSCIPVSEFGESWPAGVPVQVHLMEEDAFALEGDLDAARELADATQEAELFLYPGDRHLFADLSLADYDRGAATLLLERVLDFLERV